MVTREPTSPSMEIYDESMVLQMFKSSIKNHVVNMKLSKPAQIQFQISKVTGVLLAHGEHARSVVLS